MYEPIKFFSFLAIVIHDAYCVYSMYINRQCMSCKVPKYNSFHILRNNKRPKILAEAETKQKKYDWLSMIQINYNQSYFSVLFRLLTITLTFL